MAKLGVRAGLCTTQCWCAPVRTNRFSIRFNRLRVGTVRALSNGNAERFTSSRDSSVCLHSGRPAAWKQLQAISVNPPRTVNSGNAGTAAHMYAMTVWPMSS